MDSQTLMIVAITVVICALVAVGAWIALDRARSRRLREHFGPEYDHVMHRMPNRNLAEAELQSREQRVKKFRIVPLSSQDRAHYRETWAAVQNRFVDDPQGAVKEGHGQIFEVMEKRGYPVTNFEQAAADLSVDYPDVVENYRSASAIARFLTNYWKARPRPSKNRNQCRAEAGPDFSLEVSEKAVEEVYGHDDF